MFDIAKTVNRPMIHIGGQGLACPRTPFLNANVEFSIDGTCLVFIQMEMFTALFIQIGPTPLSVNFFSLKVAFNLKKLAYLMVFI